MSKTYRPPPVGPTACVVAARESVAGLDQALQTGQVADVFARVCPCHRVRVTADERLCSAVTSKSATVLISVQVYDPHSEIENRSALNPIVALWCTEEPVGFTHRSEPFVTFTWLLQNRYTSDSKISRSCTVVQATALNISLNTEPQ